ncbi:MAG: CsbD family protein [Caldilineaceae bacterium]|nr:CsbD family protein [Caldilineaceae bacterium]MCB9139333.1 CsbD family protein [Caldilineaceae bacterium]
MNKDSLQGSWKQLTGSVKEKWGELTNDDLTQVEGSYEKLVGKIQERYGHAREDAERAVNEWLDSLQQ